MRINKSAARTIDITDFVSSKSKPTTLTEISKALHIPKSSALEILNTLSSKNIIDIREHGNKTVKLSWKLLEMSATVLSRNDLHQEAQSHLVFRRPYLQPEEPSHRIH